MSRGGHRVVPFADEVVGVEWSGARARALAELAFGPGPDGDERLPDVIFRLGARADTGMLTLFEGRTCVYRGDAPGTAVHLLVQAVLDRLIRASAGGLVLHAAVLARGNSGLLLPGPTGSGKTMLAAWLTARGFDHLSDEACYLADGASTVAAFARPFCFKGEWAGALGLACVDRRDVLQDDAVSLVSPAVLGARVRCSPIVPRMIVFPSFRAGATLELTRLTPARAAVRLIETVANARNLRDHGVARVAALAGCVEAYSMTYGRFDQLNPFVQLIEALD